MTKKSNLESYLFSVVGVIAMFVILAAVYVISHVAAVRVDVTSDRANTLSAGTRAILKKLDTPVQIRFFASQGREMPVEIKSFVQRVEDLLKEYQKIGGKNIEIKKLNPEPDSDAEDAANLAGVEGQQLPGGEKLYLGLGISMLDSKAAIPFLNPQRERLLEYDITRAISQVMTTDKQVIGVMSGLPIFGQQMNPMMAQMGQRGSEPWIFLSELKRDFTVKQVEMTADKIDDDVKILLVVHPKNITDKAQYAIDQFIMRGGKLVAFLDPLSYVESQSMPQQQRFQMAAQGGSNLEKLLKAWGLSFDASKVMADMTYKYSPRQGGQTQPAVLTLTEEAINTNDVVTSQINNLFMLFPGAFSGTPVAGLTETVLAHTSTESALIDRFMAEFSGENAAKDFKPSGKMNPLAVRLVGKFKTAFPDGKPKDTAPPADGEKKEETPAGDSLKESKAETAVILVADTDMLYDQFAVRTADMMGQKIILGLANGNLPFVQNMVEQLSGDNNLIGIRSRASQNRPFTRVRDMEAQASKKAQARIDELTKSVQEAQTRLQELQRTKEGQQGNQRFIISPEQQAEIEKLRKKQAEVNRDLKLERKNLRHDVDALETKLKYGNIFGMPALVAAAGISLAIFKRKKTAAR
jgi:ABC-type uncharacterized transport system involved in gliding motility auxiliary subunit